MKKKLIIAIVSVILLAIGGYSYYRYKTIALLSSEAEHFVKVDLHERIKYDGCVQLKRAGLSFTINPLVSETPILHIEKGSNTIDLINQNIYYSTNDQTYTIAADKEMKNLVDRQITNLDVNQIIPALCSSKVSDIKVNSNLKTIDVECSYIIDHKDYSFLVTLIKNDQELTMVNESIDLKIDSYTGTLSFDPIEIKSYENTTPVDHFQMQHIFANNGSKVNCDFTTKEILDSSFQYPSFRNIFERMHIDRVPFDPSQENEITKLIDQGPDWIAMDLYDNAENTNWFTYKTNGNLSLFCLTALTNDQRRISTNYEIFDDLVEMNIEYIGYDGYSFTNNLPDGQTRQYILNRDQITNIDPLINAFTKDDLKSFLSKAQNIRVTPGESRWQIDNYIYFTITDLNQLTYQGQVIVHSNSILEIYLKNSKFNLNFFVNDNPMSTFLEERPYITATYPTYRTDEDLINEFEASTDHVIEYRKQY